MDIGGWVGPRRLSQIFFPITYSVLISYCFALHPYEKHELIKPEWVIVKVKTVKLIGGRFLAVRSGLNVRTYSKLISRFLLYLQSLAGK